MAGFKKSNISALPGLGLGIHSRHHQIEDTWGYLPVCWFLVPTQIAEIPREKVTNWAKKGGFSRAFSEFFLSDKNRPWGWSPCWPLHESSETPLGIKSLKSYGPDNIVFFLYQTRDLSPKFELGSKAWRPKSFWCALHGLPRLALPFCTRLVYF